MLKVAFYIAWPLTYNTVLSSRPIRQYNQVVCHTVGIVVYIVRYHT